MSPCCTQPCGEPRDCIHSASACPPTQAQCGICSPTPVFAESLLIPGQFASQAAPVPQAIAVNLREMFGFRVPIISVVIGEGGSGGALAIGVSNKNLIMEHAVYYVASPEACAAILWKSRDKAATVRTLFAP